MIFITRDGYFKGGATERSIAWTMLKEMEGTKSDSALKNRLIIQSDKGKSVRKGKKFSRLTQAGFCKALLDKDKVFLYDIDGDKCVYVILSIPVNEIYTSAAEKYKQEQEKEQQEHEK